MNSVPAKSNDIFADKFGRTHTYLRISVTDRCNLACVYCMPAEGFPWIPKEEVLSFEEIVRLVKVFARGGITNIRLTGGEPTIRRDIVELVRQVASVEGITDVAMTTNGLRLPKLAQELADAGLTRVNISVDTLNQERFNSVSGGGRISDVLDGVDAARAAGLTPVKVNTVLLKGENDSEIRELVEKFEGHNGETELRFIEYMPFGERRCEGVVASDVRDIISKFRTVVPTDYKRGGGPAVGYEILESGLKLGFISPLSEKFCEGCNRLRLMADGNLRTCLSDDGTPSLRDLIRGSITDEDLFRAVQEMVMGKREGHGCTVEGGDVFEGVMTRIGG
jgi:cyclic pyranopterin phosphate synthase